MEGLTVFEGDVHHLHHRLHIVGVHVEDQRFGDLRHVRAVGGAACVEVVGGEAHLVVHNNVNGAARAVAVEGGHLGHFVHHALTGDGRVAVNQNRQHTGFIAVPRIDAGACNAFHHRIHRLEVRGVGGQGDGDLFSGVRHLLA